MIKILLSLLLTFNILFGSLGLSIYKHTCRIFNQTETTFFEPKSCCESANDGDISINVPCCSFKVTQFEIPAMVKSFDVEPIQFIGLFIVKASKSPFFALSADLLTKKQSIQIPPLIEEDFQSWNQVYII
jgi:hypothetical protein